MREIILYLSYITKNNWEKMDKLIKTGNFKIDWDLYLELNENKQTKFLTFMDKDYPQSLSVSTKSPFLFMYDGNINLLKKEKSMLLFSIEDIHMIINAKRAHFLYENDESAAIIVSPNTPFYDMVINNKKINKIIMFEGEFEEWKNSQYNNFFDLRLRPDILLITSLPKVNEFDMKEFSYQLCDYGIYLNSNEIDIDGKEQIKQNLLHHNKRMFYIKNHLF